MTNENGSIAQAGKSRVGSRGDPGSAGSRLELSRLLGNPMVEANAMSHLGFIAQQGGNHAEAQRLQEHALAIARKFGVLEFELQLVRHLGEIALVQGDFKKAQAHFRQALATSKEIGNAIETIYGLEAAAALAVQFKQHEHAAEFLGGANALREVTGTPRSHDAQELFDEIFSECSKVLGDASCAEVIARGHALAPDVAVANALAWLVQN